MRKNIVKEHFYSSLFFMRPDTIEIYTTHVVQFTIFVVCVLYVVYVPCVCEHIFLCFIFYHCFVKTVFNLGA